MFLKIFIVVLVIIILLTLLPALHPYKCYECFSNGHHICSTPDRPVVGAEETEPLELNIPQKFKSDITDNISMIYKEQGLLFRGLENCSDGITDSCIEKEIDGPHESVPNVLKNQGATTFLKGGDNHMNPIFYTDLHGGYPIILIFTPDIVTKNSCAFIQDAGLNGCPDGLEVCGNFNERQDKCADTDCSTKKKCDISDNDLDKHECVINNCYFKDCFNAKAPTDVAEKCYFTPYKCDAQWQHSNNKKPNPKYFGCTFNNQNQLSDLQKGYNKFNNEMKNLASSTPEIFESGAILMKENQVSSFWDSTTLDSLLGVGYIYDTEDPDRDKTFKTIKPNLKTFQQKFKGKYLNDLPFILITRSRDPEAPFIKNPNNGSVYYGQFKELEFSEVKL